jgi:hypothetical protein
MLKIRVGLEHNRECNSDQLPSGEANFALAKQINVCVSVIRYRIHRAAGNGLGRGGPTRERGQ